MTRFQLTIHAEKLPKGAFRRPNPYAVVTVTGGSMEGTELGRTETIQKTVDPDWLKTIFIETDSSVFLPLRVTIYDDRGTGRDDVVIAEATFEATEVFQSPGRMQREEVKGAKIYVSIEESVKGQARGRFSLQLRGLDIKNVEPGLLGLGRSDPFVEIAKKNADHSAGYVRWNTVYRSNHIPNHLNPYWDPVTFDLEEICYNELNHPLKISVYDFEGSGKHRVIGEFETTIPTLVDRVSIKGNADRQRAFEIFREGGTKTRGLIVVCKAKLDLEEG